jgi:hypothetical protein
MEPTLSSFVNNNINSSFPRFALLMLLPVGQHALSFGQSWPALWFVVLHPEAFDNCECLTTSESLVRPKCLPHANIATLYIMLQLYECSLTVVAPKKVTVQSFAPHCRTAYRVYLFVTSFVWSNHHQCCDMAIL